MYLHRQSVWDFVHASEALLKTQELTDAETEAIAEMLYRLSEKLLIYETCEGLPALNRRRSEGA